MSTETDMAVLKNDVNRMMLLFEKADTTINKIEEVSSNIVRMLAVHEERLSSQNETDQELFTLLENRRQEIQSDIKELHSRITTVSRELSEDINETEQRLMTAMTYGMSDIKKCITDDTKNVNKTSQELEARVSDLERWKWLVVGGSVVAGAFVHEVVFAFFK